MILSRIVPGRVPLSSCKKAQLGVFYGQEGGFREKEQLSPRGWTFPPPPEESWNIDLEISPAAWV